MATPVVNPITDGLLLRIAGQDIIRFKVLAIGSDSNLYYADRTNTEHIGKVIGVSISSVLSGSNVLLRTYGRIDNSSWAWDVTKPIYLDTHGNMTQTLPGGYNIRIAKVLLPTSILVDIDEVIDTPEYEINLKKWAWI